jgi:hypothetical protein
MPEPTTTITQEWQRISLKILREGSYEKITRAELKFITSTYDRTNTLIYIACNTIKLNTISVIENMINKNDERLNIHDRIDVLIKLYLSIILLITIATITDIDSQIIQRLINSSLNKIPEIKLKISRHLLESDPEVIQLYNIFDMFMDIIY